MEVVSRLTDRYCERTQVLMEITTGDKLTQVIQDTSIRLNFGISQPYPNTNVNWFFFMCT